MVAELSACHEGRMPKRLNPYIAFALPSLLLLAAGCFKRSGEAYCAVAIG
jgi:hypothetical protein